jgi:hypothetical protein
MLVTVGGWARLRGFTSAALWRQLAEKAESAPRLDAGG